MKIIAFYFDTKNLTTKCNFQLLEPSIPQLCDGLTSQATAHSTIQVFCNMAMTRPQPLADHTNIIKRTAENFPKTALASIQLMCLIAKTSQVRHNFFKHILEKGLIFKPFFSQY